MHPQPQEIISAALELRDRLVDGASLRIPFADADLDQGAGIGVDGTSTEPAFGGVDPLYGERMRVAGELARFLDPRYPASEIVEAAARRRDEAWGRVASFSPKVFVDLTRLCRDRCGYCTFVRNPLSSVAEQKVSPGRAPEPYLLPEEVLSIAEAGRRAGCREALFTLGDRPEDRYPVARAFLARMGYDSTPHYLYDCARLVLKETGLLPHLNPGVMTSEELCAYKNASASCGMMLETTSYRLFADPSGCHYGCPDKHPSIRVDTIEAAGAARVPFTTGVLIGIGESLEARADTLIVLAALARRHGHIQEVIVQNFRAKPRIPMRNHPEPSIEEIVRTVALARLLLPDEVAVQAPPNLSPGRYGALLGAGLSDWGGISPVTLDHVNPEAAWPGIAQLRRETESQDFRLRARLCVYPSFAMGDEWVSDGVRHYLERASDGVGWAAVDGALAIELDCGETPEAAAGRRG